MTPPDLTADQASILAVLVATIAAFLWGRWRHDMVAIGALLACVFLGLLPGSEAFLGLGHPAVITVACVLVLSSGLQRSGAVDILAQKLLPGSAPVFVVTTVLFCLAAALSAFMNNVGALALLMPLGIQLADRHQVAPSKILMPLSYASILGGMTTLIGTPPNLIVAGFREELGEGPFEIFDFTPVGIVVACAGVAFVLLVGRRLVPERPGAHTEDFEIDAYLTEVKVSEDSKVVGLTLRKVEATLREVDARVVGLIRDGAQIPAPSPFRDVRAGDGLLIYAEPDALATALSGLGLEFDRPEVVGETESAKALQSDDVVLAEFVVLPNSTLADRSAATLGLRGRYGINLLGLSRQGGRSFGRLQNTPIRTGDVLLLQGDQPTLSEFAAQVGCAPLAERTLYLPDKRAAAVAVGSMVLAIGLAASGTVPAVIAFAVAILVSIVFGVISPASLYKDIDWPVIVLLGALIPVAGVLGETGAADLMARFLLEQVARGDAILALAVVLVVTMTLSDFMNNAATAAVMCPIAIGTAERLDVSSDPFLMAVAVGASCAFLTPIGHQNNSLILGPAGLRFGDYWRLGLPLEVIVVAVGLPMIVYVWPL